MLDALVQLTHVFVVSVMFDALVVFVAFVMFVVFVVFPLSPQAGEPERELIVPVGRFHIPHACAGAKFSFVRAVFLLTDVSRICPSFRVKLRRILRLVLIPSGWKPKQNGKRGSING